MGFASPSPELGFALRPAPPAQPPPRGGTDSQRRRAGATSARRSASLLAPPSAERAPPPRARGPTARAAPALPPEFPGRGAGVCGAARGLSRGRDEVELRFKGGSSPPHQPLGFEPEKHPRAFLPAPLSSTTALPALIIVLKDGSGREGKFQEYTFERTDFRGICHRWGEG